MNYLTSHHVRYKSNSNVCFGWKSASRLYSVRDFLWEYCCSKLLTSSSVTSTCLACFHILVTEVLLLFVDRSDLQGCLCSNLFKPECSHLVLPLHQTEQQKNKSSLPSAFATWPKRFLPFWIALLRLVLFVTSWVSPHPPLLIIATTCFSYVSAQNCRKKKFRGQRNVRQKWKTKNAYRKRLCCVVFISTFRSTDYRCESYFFSLLYVR